jgi:excisionase family DNA binding protein
MEGLYERLLLGVPEAAELLGGISPTTVRRLIAAGDLPVIRLGTRVLIERKSLERWIEQTKHYAGNPCRGE